ncbi:MAG TPA: AI-2E family transporter, partial [Variovorax sp.]
MRPVTSDSDLPSEPPPPGGDRPVLAASRTAGHEPLVAPVHPRPGAALPAAAAVFSGNGVLTVGAILAMLYLGRPVLVPVTLAVVLSFAIAPVIRTLRRRFGMGHVLSVLVAVSALGVMVLALAGVIGVQTVQMASNAAQYEATVKTKVQALRALTVARMEPVWGAAERLTESLADRSA